MLLQKQIILILRLCAFGLQLTGNNGESAQQLPGIDRQAPPSPSAASTAAKEVYKNATMYERTMTSAASEHKILSRGKRFVAFPVGSSFSCAICATTGVIGNPNVNYLSMGLNWGVAYDLPNITWVLQNLRGFGPGSNKMIAEAQIKRRHRRDLYGRLETLMSSKNNNHNNNNNNNTITLESGKHRSDSVAGGHIEPSANTLYDLRVTLPSSTLMKCANTSNFSPSLPSPTTIPTTTTTTTATTTETSTLTTTGRICIELNCVDTNERNASSGRYIDAHGSANQDENDGDDDDDDDDRTKTTTTKTTIATQLQHKWHRVLSRPKRYLSFPEGSSFSVAVCFTVGIIGNPRYNYMSYGLNFGVAYDLPNTSWVLNQLHGFAQHPVPPAVLRRRTRRAFYADLATLVDSMGYNGRDCIMRTLCESRQYFQRTKMGMIGEMLRVLFSLPKQRIFSRELDENADIVHYDRAYRRARDMDCERQYDCHFSLLELALGKYSNPPPDYYSKGTSTSEAAGNESDTGSDAGSGAGAGVTH